MIEEAQRLFERGRAMPPDARAAFLETACGGDARLHDDVASLLAHAEAGEAFFARLRGALFAPAASGSDASGSDPMVGRTFGRYHIRALIGRGGMGSVYRAHDPRLDREVALKFLPPSLGVDADAEERLLAEARAAAGLEHANVCTIHEIGETDDGRPFIITWRQSRRTAPGRWTRARMSTRWARCCTRCWPASRRSRAPRRGPSSRD